MVQQPASFWRRTRNQPREACSSPRRLTLLHAPQVRPVSVRNGANCGQSGFAIEASSGNVQCCTLLVLPSRFAALARSSSREIWKFSSLEPVPAALALIVQTQALRIPESSGLTIQSIVSRLWIEKRRAGGVSRDPRFSALTAFRKHFALSVHTLTSRTDIYSG
jgi:hypothetical protein